MLLYISENALTLIQTMDYHKKIISLISLLFILTLVLNFQLFNQNSPKRIGEVLGVAEIIGTPYLIWNGEIPFKTESGTSTSIGCFEGSGCFEGWQDAYHPPVVKLDNLTSIKKNLSDYDEIRFYAKSAVAGKTIDFRANESWGKKGIAVNINPYIDGGTLDTTTWRLVAIPTALLDNGALMEIYNFGFGKSNINNTIYIDSLTAVKVANPQIPAIDAIPPLEISGNINMITTGNITIKNTGNISLIIESIALSGANAGDFSAINSAMTIDPGQTRTIAIDFKPVSAGNKSAILTINHNKTLLGYNTIVPISAIAIDPSIIVPITPPNTGPISLRSTSFSSSKVSLAWSPREGADKTRIYVGSEPPAILGGNLPIKKLIATLSGTASSYTITNLSAATDVFIRVESLASETLLASDTIHVKTIGGPKANLDIGSPLREAHLVAPNIIELVIANNGVTSYDDTVCVNNVCTNPNPYNYDNITGYNGEDWQAGPWTVVKSGGSTSTVTGIYRNSISSGQPYYSAGWPVGLSNGNKVDVDHHIYIKLSQNIGNNEILTITGPMNFKTILPYSDRYLETPTIQVNQVGYSPQATRRYAYVSNWLGDGGGLNLSSFPTAAEVIIDNADLMAPRTAKISNLPITQRKSYDPDSGGEVREIDLSSNQLISEGTVYRVRIPGVGISWPTQVSNSAIFKAFYTNIRGVYFNRYGRDLQPSTAGIWSTHGPDHSTVYTSDYPSNNRADIRILTQPVINSRTVTGGHHDAGDFDLQVDHYKHSLMLLDIYESNPAIFTDRQLNIPESGNGIPDLLDEALYNLRGWEQLQDYGNASQGIINYEPAAIAKNDGAVRGGVESYRHPAGYFFAEADRDPYWTYAKDVKWSLAFAGSFAKASRLVAPFNTAKSNELKLRAIAAYNYSVNNYPSTFGKEASSTRGFMFYASGELYALTGEVKYSNAFSSTWNRFALTNGSILIDKGILSSNSETPYNIAPFFFGYLQGPNSNATYVHNIINGAGNTFTSLANAQVTTVNNDSAHRRAKSYNTTDTSNAWGIGNAGGIYLFTTFDRLKANDLNLSNSADALLPAARQQYINAISLAADYLLGANPTGMSWITGLGSRRVEEPVHTDSLSFIKEGKGPVPGLHVYGVTGGIPGNGYYKPAEYVSYPRFKPSVPAVPGEIIRPIMRRWGESRSWPALNEVDTSLTITDVMLFAALLPKNEVLTPPSQMQPQGSDYTNPLAPRYAVNSSARVEIITPPPLPPPPCIENWTYSTWSACVNSNQTRTAIDNNACGTIINRLSLSQGCTSVCSPNWTCSSWTTCTNLNKSRTCTDTNSCGITVGKPAIVSACTADSGGAGAGQVIDLLTSSTALKNDGSGARASTEIKPSVTDGIIAKIANSPAVYYISNAFRYLFVNRLTYSTWSRDVGDATNNFSTLKLISQSDFEKAAFGSNIPAKPGSLIKFDNSPKAYGVGPEAKLYEIADLAAQKALYGLWTPYIIQTGFRDSYFDHGNAVGILTATSTKPQ